MITLYNSFRQEKNHISQKFIGPLLSASKTVSKSNAGCGAQKTPAISTPESRFSAQLFAKDRPP
jgi:hypothetical protein